MILKLNPISRVQLDRFLKSVTLSEEQEKYIGGIREYADSVKKREHVVGLLLGGIVIGILKLDPEYSEDYPFAGEKELGLSGFLIDEKYQGEGYGTQCLVLLKGFVMKNFVEASAVCLTVNFRNKGAIKCYLKSGFSDTGEIFFGGNVGPQKVMRLSI
ncbi:GNAT family N-acetyltransferase [Marinobacter sp. NFXS9]|uniref:GNAT family N-acetyltransferase n=1 Tax=Marinobacter sp. NFXS9 TaxID=2818433 RepID=UPI0032DECD79